jgi:hypothetical protein
MLVETLTRLAARFDRKKNLAGPNRLQIKEQEWITATDGRVMLWVHDKPEDIYPLIPARIACSDPTYPRLVKLFEPWPESVQQPDCNLRSLKDFAGPIIWTILCPHCEGKSRGNEHLWCTYCEGDDDIAPETRHGYLYGAPFNLHLLAYGLAPFAGPQTVRVFLDDHFNNDEERKGTPACLWIIADTWRVVLVGMTPDLTDPSQQDEAKAWAEAPRFP